VDFAGFMAVQAICEFFCLPQNLKVTTEFTVIVKYTRKIGALILTLEEDDVTS
jgi:hypothetical protein